ADNVGEYSSLISDIKTYRDEMTIKFIRGTEPLDNFDKYLSTLDSMGIARLQEIVQIAVDEYNNR
ncbi:MAG: ABC transporter substrate-binding protein, partial [Hungatella sp.]